MEEEREFDPVRKMGENVSGERTWEKGLRVAIEKNNASQSSEKRDRVEGGGEKSGKEKE